MAVAFQAAEDRNNRKGTTKIYSWRWRLPFGAAEDRNLLYAAGTFVHGNVAVVPRVTEDRNTEDFWLRYLAEREGGDLAGRPRIATTRRSASTGFSRVWRSPFGVIEDRNNQKITCRKADVRVAVALRGDGGSQQLLRPVRRDRARQWRSFSRATEDRNTEGGAEHSSEVARGGRLLG